MLRRKTTESNKSTDTPLTLAKKAVEALESVPTERAISAMEVVIWYVAIVGRVEHYKRGEEHVFRITREFVDSRPGEEWEEKPLNAYAVRDRFLAVKEWSEALEFLGSTGVFSPLGDSITWSEFQRWQRFAYLAQEHDGLAAAMQSGRLSGEYGEVLKALTGIYPTSFFNIPERPETELEAKWKKDPEIGRMIQEGNVHQELRLRRLCAWFREPEAAATSIQWAPKRDADKKAVWRKLQAGGAMIDFLLPQSALQPVLLIRPMTTLQAIASAIYGDRIHGVEYRACEMCKALFKVGAHKEKKYCDRERCKNRAHQRNRRAASRDKESGTTQNKKARKGGIR
jgi:hypothetical protein